MNPGAGDQFFPYEYPQYPPGWIYPLPGLTSLMTEESQPISIDQEDSSMPASTPSSSRSASSSAENKKAQDRWSKEEEKLLVQLWAEKHDQLESRESQGANSMVLCFVHRFCS